MKQEENKKIEDLLDISYIIIVTYYRLMLCEIANNKEEYQKNTINLNLALEVEDKIYSNFYFHINQRERIANKIEYLLQRREYEDFEKEAIMERIYNYFFQAQYINPFLSMEQDNEIQNLENIIAITNQYYLDYHNLANYLLTKEIKEITHPGIKEDLIQSKYERILSYKLEEKILLKEDLSNFPIPTGKERCLLFNQNKDLVREIYIMGTTNEIERVIKDLTPSTHSTTEECQYLNILFQINIEAMMRLLEKEEQESVIVELWNQKILNKENSNINNRILTIISKINQETKSQKK